MIAFALSLLLWLSSFPPDCPPPGPCVSDDPPSAVAVTLYLPVVQN